MKPWKRLGGRGTFIQLYGTEGLWGMYVVEVPAGGALNIERHIYEKQVLVVDGRGSTEVWHEGQPKKQTFEWQKGSLFSIPLNAYHRFVNATKSPAMLLCGTAAPNIINLVDNPHFVFNCPYNFTERYRGADDYFKPRDDIAPDPVRGLAMTPHQLHPRHRSTASCRSTTAARPATGAWSRTWPRSASTCGSASTRTAAIPRRTSTTSSAVLICLKGKGYTYTWPEPLGPTPWKDGSRRQGAAPGLRADRHGLGRADERRLVPPALRRQQGAAALHRLVRPQQPRTPAPAFPARRWPTCGAIDVNKGGKAIPYWLEDPYLRKEYEAELAKEGIVIAHGGEALSAAGRRKGLSERIGIRCLDDGSRRYSCSPA